MVYSVVPATQGNQAGWTSGQAFDSRKGDIAYTVGKLFPYYVIQCDDWLGTNRDTDWWKTFNSINYY